MALTLGNGLDDIGNGSGYQHHTLPVGRAGLKPCIVDTGEVSLTVFSIIHGF